MSGLRISCSAAWTALENGSMELTFDCQRRTFGGSKPPKGRVDEERNWRDESWYDRIPFPGD